MMPLAGVQMYLQPSVTLDLPTLKGDRFVTLRRGPRYRRSTLGRRAFFVADPMAWNVLPDDFQDPSLSANNFRKMLKTHLFRNALGHLAH